MLKVIGTGAAGNKAAINLIEKEVLPESDVLLVNSTIKDIPANYRQNAIVLNDNGIGCGKERELGANMTYQAIQDGKLDILDEFIKEEDIVVVVNSTEGGTGSSSGIIIANYIDQVIGVPVIRFAFSGFEEDGRGLQNTIEYFKDCGDESTVQLISNKLFGTNKIKAEKAANDEFAKRIEILGQKGIVDSEQNIDITDFFKIIKTEGFMFSDKILLPRLKNEKQFNDLLSEAIDDNKSLNIIEPSAKRIGVFLNLSSSNADNIDYSFQILKDKLGSPYELFSHIQIDEDGPEFVSFIASGMDMPIEEIKECYEKYKKESAKVNKKKNNFLEQIDFKGNQEDAMFNSASMKATKKDKKDFLKSFSPMNSSSNEHQLFNKERRMREINTEVQQKLDETKDKVKTSKKEYIKNNY